MFSNEIETSGGHILGTAALWEVLLGFLDAPRIPLQQYIDTNDTKIGKVPRIAGNHIFFGRPSHGLSIESET